MASTNTHFSPPRSKCRIEPKLQGQTPLLEQMHLVRYKIDIIVSYCALTTGIGSPFVGKRPGKQDRHTERHAHGSALSHNKRRPSRRYGMGAHTTGIATGYCHGNTDPICASGEPWDHASRPDPTSRHRPSRARQAAQPWQKPRRQPRARPHPHGTRSGTQPRQQPRAAPCARQSHAPSPRA